jgi:type IV secretory pathway VirB10-like protein
MRCLIVASLFSILASAQNAPSAPSNGSPAKPTEPAAAAKAPDAAKPAQLLIPAGTKVPLSLKHAISTKQTKEGDAVYAETTFPVVLNDRVLIPAGTYVQGRISHIQRAGRIKGRAEVLMHFTTLIYPSGYTVMLPGSLENAPGVDNSNMKGEEGTIRGDSQAVQKVGTVAGTAATGTVIGAATSGGKGALIGAGIGGAVGSAIALLTRGNDVKMDAGTTLEMVIQRDIPVDASRVPTVTRTVAVQ